MKIHLIEIVANKLEPSIWNTAKDFIEGRNILIKCLARGAKKSEEEVIEWLKENGKEIYELDKI